MTPMRTDVKVGLICAGAIVLCVVIFVATRGKATPAPAHADSNVRGSGSDLRTVTPPTPGNPIATSGEVVRPPGSNTPTTDVTAGGAGTSAMGVPPMGGASGGAAAGTTGGGVATAGGMGGAGAGGLGGGPTVPLIPAPGGAGAGGVAGAGAAGAGAGAGAAGGLGGATLVLPPGGTSTGATTYKIQKGDMLIAIAKKNNVSLQALKDANPGVDPTRMKVGTEIKIPVPAALASVPATRPSTPGGPVATPGARAPGATTPAIARTVTIRPGSTYVIKRGDTLATISKAAYGNTSERAKIFQANRDKLEDPDVMPAGVSIKIP